MEKLTRCVVCSKVMNNKKDEIKTLFCLHSGCKTCLQKHFDSFKNSPNKNPKCPLPECQYFPTMMELDDLETSQPLFIVKSRCTPVGSSNPDEDSKPLECVNCSEDANWYCVDCEAFLDDRCKEGHSKIKFLADHKIVSLEDYKKGDFEVSHFCPDHPEERINLFCDSCKKISCVKCAVIGSHKDHKFYKLEEVHKHFILESRKHIEWCAKTEETLDGIIKKILNHLDGFGSEIKRVKDEIESSRISFLEMINKRHNELIVDVKLKEISVKKELLNRFVT